MFDHSKLIGRIIEKFKTRQAFAEAMNMSASVLTSRLNGDTHFTDDEIALAIELLEIPPDEIKQYFFTPKVR